MTNNRPQCCLVSSPLSDRHRRSDHANMPSNYLQMRESGASAQVQRRYALLREDRASKNLPEASNNPMSDALRQSFVYSLSGIVHVQ